MAEGAEILCQLYMYKQNKPHKRQFITTITSEGETIETKMRRVTNNKEPITDGAPIIYTERKDGVNPGYNIRTDKWDIMVDAMDKTQASAMAKRNNGIADRDSQKRGFKDAADEATQKINAETAVNTNDNAK